MDIMNELIEIIKGIYELIMIPTIIVIIIIAVIKSSESKTAQKLETKVKQEQEEKTTQPIIQKPAFCAYQRKKILTKNEYYFYTKLKEVTNKYNLQILTKIRLADLIEVKPYSINRNEWGTYFNKIKAKHIDFAIVDNMKVLLIIELDDQSHNNIERIERDKFVDDNLTACGYKIVHTRGAIDAIEKELQTVTKNANVPPLE
jgi:hypothetical protein